MNSESTTLSPGPLHLFHQQRGATFGGWGESETVEHYGDWQDEVRRLGTGAGLFDRSAVGRLELVGKDRQRFLHGLVTCDVLSMTPGQAVYGFFTTGQGKILADVWVLALEDRLWLELPAGKVDAIAAHLKKYIIADKVEVSPLEAFPLTLLGPRAEAVLVGETALPSEPLRHFPTRLGGVAVTLLRRAASPQPGFDLWVRAESAEALAQHLAGLPGVSLVGQRAFEQVRVEAGLPAFGVDFGEQHFPQESGLEAQAVSYTKGCYLGQEIVARIHYRGKANHLLTRLRFAGPLPTPGARLLFEGQEVGRVGSAVFPLSGGDGIGLAVVHRKGGEPGTSLEVEGFGSAEVLPTTTD